MKDIERLSRLALTLFMTAAFVLSSGSWAIEDETDSGGLVLDVYADDAGKALVTGYAKEIEGLPFLNSSEYIYDDEARQLYAVTNALTWKNGEDWEIRLPAEGSYGEYHVTFYLSENVQLSNITGTAGLDYLVSSSSDSFAVEFHGYDVMDPSAAVRYRQPLSNGDAEVAVSGPQAEDGSSPHLVLVGALIIALITIAAAVGFRRPEGASPRHEDIPSDGEPVEIVSEAGASDLRESDHQEGRAAEEDLPGEEARTNPSEEEMWAHLSTEMAAVMETLTERERSVLEALMKHGGKITQAEIRYETGIPKSSLTGIIVSLERRNIVTKKEWGRTNVIELAERLR